MSDETPRHELPYIMASQAQKHVTHNEALRLLDGLCSLYLIETDATSAPASPGAGDSYCLGAAPGGEWQNHGGDIAFFVDGGWIYSAPFDGLRAFRLSDNSFVIFQANQWNQVISEPQSLPLLGINTNGDNTNRLAVKSDAVLFAADDLAANPTGDIRFALNRDGSLDTASMIFQTNYSANAEIGCTGDDLFKIKVSDDGIQFKEAIEIDNSTAYTGFGRAPVHALDVRDNKDGALARIRLENT